MARCRSELKFVLALVLASLAAGTVFAQNSATPVALSTPAKKKPLQRPFTATGSPSPELENVRKALEALTPEQREQFRQNFARWISLTPDDKKSLRDLQELRKKHMQEETEDALAKSGLQLDEPRRQLFAKRYTEERRKIEEALRKESEEKRGPRVEELRGRLKVEFSAPAIAPAN